MGSAVLLGTRTGVFRAAIDAIDDAVRVLDSDRVMRLRAFDDGVYAATRSGLYRSGDDGRSWTRIETPRRRVSTVHRADGGRLYIGTRPAEIYASDDDGASWTSMDGFGDGDRWRAPGNDDEATLRALTATTGRLLAGVEVGGVYVSDDGGQSWVERSPRSADVHHLLVDDERVFASTGGGLYRSRNLGRSWTRLDSRLDHRYFREATVHEGCLYTAATVGPPPSWDGPRNTDAGLYESHDGGDTLRPVEYAGGPGEFVLSWATGANSVYGGTTAGSVIERQSGTWLGIGSVPAEIASMTILG
ncbi:MAG: glycosyl hydrolase [Natronomonas sp.]